MDWWYELTIEPYNATVCKVYGSIEAEMRLSERYSYKIENFHFIKTKLKNKKWNGVTKLYNRVSKTLSVGLMEDLLAFCKNEHIKVTDKRPIDNGIYSDPDKILKLFLEKQPIPHTLEYFQENSIKLALKERRGIHVCGTGGGKSLILYCVSRIVQGRVLIIVPSLNLLHQLKANFKEYSICNNWNVDENVHLVYSGQEKFLDTKITISTWQSLYKQPISFFENFKSVVVDECHEAEAKSLTTILRKCTTIHNRWGFSGSIKQKKTNLMLLIASFGKVNYIKTARELIDEGFLAQLKIRCFVLKYPDEICEQYKKTPYREEIDFLSSYTPRINFICKLACKIPKKCLITFRFIESQGDLLYAKLKELNPDKPIYYITGKMAGEERERIRLQAEADDNCILLATESIFSTGINIRSLDYVIPASPSKASIRIIQTIGRILRKSDTTVHACVIDIVDDLQYKKRQNFALKHFVERCQIYIQENHKYTIEKVTLV